MRARVVTIANPFDPLGSRTEVEVRRPLRVRQLAPRTRLPHLALLNGRPLLRAGWRRRLRPGDSLVFAVLPRGGGQGGGSNPLRTILSLGLMIVAMPLAGAMLGAAAGTVLFGSYTLGQATALGVVMAGSALLNAVLPPPQAPQGPQASPTYSLSAQGNVARLEQAIPVQYGRMRFYPDLAAQPYAEFYGGDQFLYQLFCLGAGEFDVEAIEVEDTPISSFGEITTELIPPGGELTLFPANVVTSPEVAGQTLRGRADVTWSRSGTTVTITEAVHNRPVGTAVSLAFTSGTAPADGVYVITGTPTADTWTVAAASGGGSGAVQACSVLGGAEGFVASDAGSVARSLAFDFILPRGLYANGSSGRLATLSLGVRMQARPVDDAGAPTGPWTTLDTRTFADRTVTPIRSSRRYGLPAPGRYRVRAWRTDVASTNPSVGHEIIWAGLRAYLAETQDYGPVTLLAMRAMATNNLSLQASRKIAVTATRKVRTWTGSGWSAPVASRSIAWAIADAARDPDYGGRLPDGRIDLASLLALDATWAARGDRFDARFDQAGTWWEAVSRIAAAGRARVFMQGGRLRCVRDGPQAVPVQLFSMRNIRRGSFVVDLALPSEDMADQVVVRYLDGRTWAPSRVVAALPGSARLRPAFFDPFGVTTAAQALRDGLHLAASNRLRRLIVRFATEMEGMICSIGDLVAIQHDSVGWGQHAAAVAWAAGPRVLTVSEPFAWGSGSHYVVLRRPDGATSGPWEVAPEPDPRRLRLLEAPDMVPYVGDKEERTHVVFGPGQTWSALAKVASITPRGLYEAEVEAVVEDPAVHAAELGAVPPPPVYSQLPRRARRPVALDLRGRRVPSDLARALLSWAPASGATLYEVEQAEGEDPLDPDVSWTGTAATAATSLAITLLFATRTMIRARAIGALDGPWTYTTLGSLIPDFWIADGAAFWTSDAAAFWS